MSEKSPGHRPKRQRPEATALVEQTNSPASDVASKPTKKRPRKSDDPTLTARGLRQKFETSSVTELLQRRHKTLAVPLNGPGASGDDTIHAIFEHVDTKFADKTVDSVFDAINRADVLDHIEARIAARKRRKDAPPPSATGRCWSP